MPILLTGSTGHIGSSVLSSLIERGHDVVALIRSDGKAEVVADRGARAVVGDITDLALLQRFDGRRGRSR